MLGHAHRTYAGTAAAVRRGESLVQVDVHDVEAHVAGTGVTHDGVEVGAVVVAEAARLMHDVDELADDGVEHARILRVRVKIPAVFSLTAAFSASMLG